MSVSIRLATKSDIPTVLELIKAHAVFERSGPVTATADRLAELLIDQKAAICFVAILENGSDDHGSAENGSAARGSADGPVGYATAAAEFSTWNAGHYLHMDTLFVDEEFRGHRIGQRLFDAVLDHATANSFDHVQWQTPEWNADAIRFYERTGATHSPKQRFTLDVSAKGSASSTAQR